MTGSWKVWLRLAAAGVGLAGVAAGLVAWWASRALWTAREEVQAAGKLRSTVRALSTSVRDATFETVSAPAVFLQAARFQDHLYIASPAGLLEYDSKGAPQREFSAGKELPSSPLIALATATLADAYEPELLVATAQDGVVAFNGRTFRLIYPQEQEARAITCLLPVASGHLLIGTKKRGVLLYDGKQITALHATLSGLYVQALAGNETDLWVGTLNQGVLHWHAGATESFGERRVCPTRKCKPSLLQKKKPTLGRCWESRNLTAVDSRACWRREFWSLPY